MPANRILRWFACLLESLQSNRQRQLVVLQGEQSWCDAALDILYQTDPELLLISSRQLGRSPVPLTRADGLLGGDSRLVVLDLFTGLDADVLCIAAGLVRAGGVLVLLSPALDDWPIARDGYACWQDQTRSRRPYFVEYFFDALAADRQIGIVLREDAPAPGIPELAPLVANPIVDGQTAEQARQGAALERWLARNGEGIALLSAARGRGKSTCLGQWVHRLKQHGSTALVSASSRRAAAQLLHWAPAAEFVAPDRLLRDPRAADVLVIDEAAMLPQSILRQLRRCYPRIVMASTHGGYEGTGQGFRLRFLAELGADELLHLELHDPVRWCPGDRLESRIDDILMLNPATQPAQTPAADEIRIELIDSAGDSAKPELMRAIHALLSAAHYRTRPSDLRMLMENPDLIVLVARAGERLLGAAILNPEGGFDAALCEQVFLGRRRPRGHLLAQMLTAQAGSRGFARHRGLRVQRIAVCREWRRRGIGRRLLQSAFDHAVAQGYAWLGASFALDWQSAQFWQRTGFALVHVSYAQGKSSGRHSIAVLRATDDRLGVSMHALRARLQRQLPVWMTQFLQFMDPDQVAALLRFADFQFTPHQLDRDDIEAFCAGNKGFELCFASLQGYVMQGIARSAQTPDRLLIEKAVQNRDWKLLRRSSACEGRRQLQNRLRGLVAGLDKAC